MRNYQAKQNNGKSKRKATHFFAGATVFPKLTINAPNDRYEQQADAMADRVMRMEEEEEVLQTMPLGGGIQRMCADCAEEEESLQTMPLMRRSGAAGGYEASPELSEQLQHSKGGGSSLPEATQARMSRAFGADFSGVKVHTGTQASAMSQSIQAKAFTHGSDIYFGKGQYQPNSAAGSHLLAHELTHVVQQGGGLNRKRIQRDSKEEEKAEITIKHDVAKGTTKTTQEVEQKVAENVKQKSSLETTAEEQKIDQSVTFSPGIGFTLSASMGAKNTLPAPGVMPSSSPFFTLSLGHKSEPFKWLSTDAKIKLSLDPSKPVGANLTGKLVFLPKYVISPSLEGSYDTGSQKAGLDFGAKLKLTDDIALKGGFSLQIGPDKKPLPGGYVGLTFTLPNILK